MDEDLTNRAPNRLIAESSPYLRQHAHNPVDWYPWGAEALTRAKSEDRPILLSIGYSACHWCHVMARESFDNPKIAQVMNRHFINIKVDREERPDLDEIYQKSAQVFTGRGGGWPLTMFLTPDQEPFYGGTYFPPVPRHKLPGFSDVLIGVMEAYR
ncbi:MAG TPA: thioredoxin domain-containing protein, partial [Nitrospira sp.]